LEVTLNINGGFGRKTHEVAVAADASEDMIKKRYIF
jgi:hypothetical protein